MLRAARPPSSPCWSPAACWLAALPSPASTWACTIRATWWQKPCSGSPGQRWQVDSATCGTRPTSGRRFRLAPRVRHGRADRRADAVPRWAARRRIGHAVCRGNPRQSLVYFARAGDRLVISTLADRLKAQDVRRSGWASLGVMAHEPPYPSATFSGSGRDPHREHRAADSPRNAAHDTRARAAGGDERRGAPRGGARDPRDHRRTRHRRELHRGRNERFHRRPPVPTRRCRRCHRPAVPGTRARLPARAAWRDGESTPEDDDCHGGYNSERYVDRTTEAPERVLPA